MNKLDSLCFGLYARNESKEVSKGSLIIMKERKNVQVGDATIIKDKVTIGSKLNLKSCIGDHNLRQEKQVKFNENVTIFSCKS